ncbi:hypothetical protein DFS33DRAFT_1265724 [Desarmillaria ectypa]|nr:hypothetical protein DFS33DRAFT_1265724 [Desarmillaria ectypa]
MIGLKWTSLFCLRDTPLCTLYRLYECTVDFNEDEMMIESQYWFHDQPTWRLADIPDPKDPDATRYAILAATAEALVQAFNYKIALGLRRGITRDNPFLVCKFKNDANPPWEECPSWTRNVGPLPQVLQLYPPLPLGKGPEPEPITATGTNPFLLRNIRANTNQLRNI